MNRRRLFLTFVACAAMLIGAVQQSTAAVITIFTTQANWASAAGAFSTENFSDATLNSDISVTTNAGHVGSGAWQDRVVLNGDQTTFSFSSLLDGFGANWDLAGPGGPGQGIALTITLFNASTQLLAQQISSNSSGQFFGFTSDVAFDKVTIRGGTQGGSAETYAMDNMVYSPATANTPEPSALAALVGLGLAGWVCLRRRK